MTSLNHQNGCKGLGIRRLVEGTTRNHAAYVEAIRTSDVTICEGPAGSLKTYLAVGMAVHALLEKPKYSSQRVDRLVITRPIVEACGEHLGFLPGLPEEKAGPYMRPIYDAIEKFCTSREEYIKLLDPRLDKVEIVPLAFMRGRTFENAFVILDEAQNATTDQMKMFLTRMGRHCKMVVTGDLAQSDLPRGSGNGLGEAIDRLDGLRSEQGKVSVCYMNDGDIVRHGLISEILDAFRGDSMACRY